jgi:hypothetical protein
MRPVMWTLIIASGLAALALSFQGLQGLADLVGLQPSALFPISVDITTTASTIAWLSGGHASRTGKHLALASIIASVAGNATFHLIALANGYATLASVVAAVPPIMLAALVHLGALLATPPVVHQEVATIPAEAGVEAAEPLVTSTDVLAKAGDPEEQEDDDQVTKVAAMLKAARDAGEPKPGRQAVADQLGVSLYQARQLLTSARGIGIVDRQDDDDDRQEPRQIAR